MPADQPSLTDAGPSITLARNKRLLRAALGITAFMMLAEAAGGFLSGSLALLADAGHMLTDVAGLGLSLIAFHFSSLPRTPAHTFGWRRFEIFAALLNGLALWVIAGAVGYQAVVRLRSPQEIKSGMMMVIAGLGLLSNVAAGAVLLHGERRNLNIKGALLHIAADALGSVGVLAAAVLIRLTGSTAWDPVVSIGVCVLILLSSGRLIRDSVHVFMEGAPAGTDVEEVQRALNAVPGVVDVHDLHVWTITSGFVSLSAHLKVAAGEDAGRVLREAHEAASRHFNIVHTTFQLEEAEAPGCETGSCPENGKPC
jgi:cobalt-zinc-cadmium efflux system protein